MSNAEWDDDIFEDDDGGDLATLDDAKHPRKPRLDIRRKLEDRMALQRLREEIGDLDLSWMD